MKKNLAYQIFLFLSQWSIFKRYLKIFDSAELLFRNANKFIV